MNATNSYAAHSFAAVVAVALTTLVGWSFIDSTHVARWVSADTVAQVQPALTTSGDAVHAG